jgi:hypothetical protein
MLNEKDKEIERLKQDEENNYKWNEKILRNIVEKRLGEEEIELLFDMILEETDKKITTYTISRFIEYGTSIYNYIVSNKMEKYSNGEKKIILERFRNIMKETERENIDSMIKVNENIIELQKNVSSKNVSRGSISPKKVSHESKSPNMSKNEEQKKGLIQEQVIIEKKGITLFF